MIRTVIIGAAGRMGCALIAETMSNSGVSLAGAVETSGHPAVGRDAGEVAGCGESGVIIIDTVEEAIQEADAVIDFSAAEATIDNARTATAAGCCVVIGTTGLAADDRKALETLADSGGRIVFAPNMSVGVNLLFHLCGEVGRTLGEDYDVEVVEMHHNRKKDAPSGTAARLGEILAQATGRDYEKDVRHGRQGMTGARERREIGMHAVRGGDVVGEHTVIFATDGERVELGHKASSRQTFAKGAVRAVKFLMDVSPGLYDMQDVLGLR